MTSYFLDRKAQLQAQLESVKSNKDNICGFTRQNEPIYVTFAYELIIELKARLDELEKARAEFDRQDKEYENAFVLMKIRQGEGQK